MSTLTNAAAFCAMAFLAAPAPVAAGEIPANTWVRIADCPGDAEGREVPPGRASTWTYCPPLKAFLRYGGYTPRFSNAMDQFDPAAGKWKRLVAEDENYPEDRPGGGCCWAMQYDEKRKLVWLAAGLGTGWTGSRGIWSYDPAAGKFACLSKDLPRGVQRLCFDPANGLFVARPWPTCDGLGDGVTMVFTVDDRKWQGVRTNPLPQGQWGSPVSAMTYDSGLGRVVGVGGGKEFWTFDGAARKWERIETAAGPSARTHTATAYDPDRKVVLLHGVHPGGYQHFDTGPLNDTWILDTSKKEWKEIKTPSPAIPPALRNVARQALAYDPDLKRFSLADPDLGVWAFRYDPAAEPGKDCVSGGFAPAVGKAAGNPPAEGAAEKLKEVRRTLPSPLNQRILDMADNSIMPLGGGGMPGDEVAWCYEPEAGVFVKYGGCGNWSNPLWAGYGNDLIYYDPGVERWYTRRSCDVSGAMRPGTGCTRSVFFDPGRKVLWFFGGAASGPYCNTPSEPVGSFAYDLKADRFLVIPGDTKAGMGGNGCMLHGDPDHLVAICPSKDKVHSFDMKTASWSAKNTPGFGGIVSGYSRTTYLKSKKVFLVLEAVTDAKNTLANRTMAYDPVAGAWADLAPKEMPPSRCCKFGLVYDSKNDVAFLLGGGTGWNTGWRNDLWVYLVKENRWEKINPTLAGGAKQLPAFTDNMPSGYDERHNAVIFTEGNSPWAYRYKK